MPSFSDSEWTKMLYPSCSAIVCDKESNRTDFFTVHYLRTANSMFAMFCGWAAKWNAVWLRRSDNCTAIRLKPVQKQERRVAPALAVPEPSALQPPGSRG